MTEKILVNRRYKPDERPRRFDSRDKAIGFAVYMAVHERAEWCVYPPDGKRLVCDAGGQVFRR